MPVNRLARLWCKWRGHDRIEIHADNGLVYVEACRRCWTILRVKSNT